MYENRLSHLVSSRCSALRRGVAVYSTPARCSTSPSRSSLTTAPSTSKSTLSPNRLCSSISHLVSISFRVMLLPFADSTQYDRIISLHSWSSMDSMRCISMPTWLLSLFCWISLAIAPA